MSVRVTTLDSGLRIVTDHMAGIRTASVGVFVGAGSRFERREENGVAHLLEHMAFKGTTRRDAKRIVEEIEDVGGDINAETAVEQTAYFARILGEDVDLALDVLGDIVTRSLFDREELEREKNVIIQEIGAAEDAPDDLIFDLFTQAAWPDQAIGRPILGTRDGVNSFDRRIVEDYLHRNYAAPSTVVVAAGAVEHDRIVAGAAKHLSGLSKAPEGTAEATVYRGGFSVQKKSLEQTHIVIGFEGRGVKAADLDAAHVFCSAVGGGMSSPLFQEVREKRGLAYSTYSFHWPYSDGGLFGIYAGVAPKNAGEFAKAAIDCFASATHSLTEKEVQRAKAIMKVSVLGVLESPGARVQQLARHMFVHGRHIPLEESLARIEALQVEEVRAAGAAILRGNPTVVAVGKVGRVLNPGQVADGLKGL